MKSICISALVGTPIVAGTIIIVQKGGSYLPLYLWAFMFVLSFTMVTLYPIVIAPLFNKFTPLPEGELKERLEKLAASQKFPLKKIFIIDGSLRSSHSNAYMYGFFNNKRIILFDTLVQQILSLLQFGGYSLVRNSKDLFLSFGFDTQPVLIGLIIFQHTVIPLQYLVSFGLNLISRASEFQADAFAKKLGYAAPLKSALVKMQEDNLSATNSDPLYSAYHYTHPGLAERLAALDGDDNENKKED